MKKIKIFFFCFLMSQFVLTGSFCFAQESIQRTIHATVRITVCGNGQIDSGEDCDGSNLGGKTCQTLGYASGTLLCRADCLFDTSSCVPSSGGGSSGGGGGGGGQIPTYTTGNLSFVGKTSPKSLIKILKDGQLFSSAFSDEAGNFQINLSNLTVGSYNFSLQAQDSFGRLTNLVNYFVNVSGGLTIFLRDILLPTTLKINQEKISPPDEWLLTGQTFPKAQVKFYLRGSKNFEFQTQANEQGFWSLKIETASLPLGKYLAEGQVFFENLVSKTTESLSLELVRKETRPEKEKPFEELTLTERKTLADLNSDGKINLVDFSILAYWYKKTNFPKAFDLNSDGKIDLIDFSILAYFWTG